MRTEIAKLLSPRPLGERLPAVYVEDEFTQKFTAALDDVLAPVFVVLDCFTAYLDPMLAPDDFVDWLAEWVALDIDHGWSDRQRRELVRHAVTLHRLRGTRKGLVHQVQLLVHGDVQVTDTGGCVWSERPGAPLPGSAPARVTVRVRVPDPAAVDVTLLTTVVGRAVPAHVDATIEVIT